MSKRRIFFATLFSLFLVAGVGACRHGHFGGGFDEFDQAAVAGRIASRLNLSDSQKTELQGIIAEIATKAKQLHADRADRQQALADLMRQETISRETVDRMIAEKFERIKTLADFAADRLLAFHATLTPEQREKAAQEIEAHGAARDCFSQH
jgi:protein CpxP